ncbi:helicase C-terminal domain-containing protein [Enterococcus dispar]|jgi:ATP-dependent DNA helicase DinG|uniref:helicase C-terminal domain-containing protein n=1 Tax=Enterococcus dispar TaxID=44009 RepID=UPI00189C7BC3|nr:helicase C-terminal domain-containing protein [Enterococcus dispar]MCU7356362.1 exonuclease domain-containing protein [Enterococcus dispar]MDT2704597.1 helicase C-terminal domain-containing protein [Enterococcus dispar]WCG33651.1 exonuclease domain-containing protein [Enterococcus dispar]
MNRNTTYAVVDIETTGTDPKVDRIIQIGCVLIRNGRLINRFATDINPGRKIPKQIQNLTHISNGRVQKAPYFEDVAFIIADLLADTVFVAHNIFFDYQFLNAELKRCGVTPLKISGIDTVELAQIFLPEESSFRLSDLAESFGLQHDNPHQADSDAEVTAALLLYIEAVMRQLPLVTLQTISELAILTAMQTGDYIKNIYQQQLKENPLLSEELEIVAGIALRKKAITLYEDSYYQKKYPQKKSQKEKLYQNELSFRKEQARLMNLVYQHFTQDETKDLLIEAATGMGKTIGYLLPASFLATPENPVIVSTVSLLLQEQIIKKDIPLLNRFLEQKIQAVVVKSKRHYLDLARFKQTLLSPVSQKQYALYQMAVLVWLTKTTTGDFGELNLINLNHLFFQDVAHRGVNYLSPKSPFYPHDFLKFLNSQMQESNCLIINHAFLAQESLRQEPLLPQSPYLIVDEAHHLPTICERIAAESFNTFSFEKKVQQVLGEDGLFARLDNWLKEELEGKRLVNLLQEELKELGASYELLADLLAQELAEHQEIVTAEDFVKFDKKTMKCFKKIELFLQESAEIRDSWQQFIQKRQFAWGTMAQFDFAILDELFNDLAKHKRVMQRFCHDFTPRYIHWVLRRENQHGLTFQVTDFEAAILPQTKWYSRFEKIVYIGGALKLTKDRNLFAKRLGLPAANLKIIPAPFDYDKQTEILVPIKAAHIPQLSPSEYSDFLAENLTILLKDFNRPALVLFTSHEVLQKVYEKMHLKFLENGREILAQGIGGSRDKLLKRFSQSDAGILFGTDSFWEGIDLPGEQLELVIVTRLPFENPKRPFVHARYDFLNSIGADPFYEESLPNAMLKLRQAYGRLIRSPKDRGVMVVLDRRFVNTTYGKQLRQAIPKKVVINELSLLEMTLEITKFLKD